jgi:Na+/H+ antiporter NhaD/arsenite permease-like protein
MSSIAWLALGIFVVAYILIASDKINKTIITLLGASLFIWLGINNINNEGSRTPFDAVDWNVIFLLISMMIIVSITKTTGIFQFVAIKAAKVAKGEPIRIMMLLTVITAFFSMFLDNVTTVLVISPIVLAICGELAISPVPFVICMAVASNLGGTATLIGDVPNILIGLGGHLSFMQFIYHLLPITIVLLVVMCLLMIPLFGKKLKVPEERKQRIMKFNEKEAITDKARMVKCLVVLALAIAGFILHDQIGEGMSHILHKPGFTLDVSQIALFAASILLLISGAGEPKQIEKVVADVEWNTILFYAGLFIMVNGINTQGWLALAAQGIIHVTGGDLKVTSVLLIWITGVLSSFIDNVSFVATMTPMIQHIVASIQVSHPGSYTDVLWWALSMGACLGGSGTLIGASANVVGAGICGKAGHPISFKEFTKYGALFTVINLVICTVYVLIRYF